MNRGISEVPCNQCGYYGWHGPDCSLLPAADASKEPRTNTTAVVLRAICEACVHDWRLINERNDTARPIKGSRTDATDYEKIARWYCTRCRLIEETTR